MTDPYLPSRRSLLKFALTGAGAAAGLAATRSSGAFAASAGRTTDTVRLTWGLSGLNLIAKERGAFDKLLAQDGIKVEWLGPFPNHAPTLQAVTGGSADFSFGGSTTPALAAIIAGSPLVFTSSSFTTREPRRSSPRMIPASTQSRISSANPLPSIALGWASSCSSPRWRKTVSTVRR